MENEHYVLTEMGEMSTSQTVQQIHVYSTSRFGLYNDRQQLILLQSGIRFI